MSFSQLISDEKSNFISTIISDDLQIVRFSSMQLPSSELPNFLVRFCGLVGNFSLKILFRLFNPLARREDFSQISYKHNVYIVCYIWMYTTCEAWEKFLVAIVLTLYQTFSNGCLLPALLFARDKISCKGLRRYWRCLYFLSPLNFLM